MPPKKVIKVTKKPTGQRRIGRTRQNLVGKEEKRLAAFEAYLLCGTSRAAQLWLKENKGIYVSHASICNWVREEMDRRKTPVIEEIRRQELERIEKTFQEHWPKALKGRVASLNAVFRCMERKAKLLGLDMPQKFETDNKVTNFTVNDIDPKDLK